MDVRELKEYIYDNEYVEQLIESIGCHHIRYHSGNGYWTCANPDGDNKSAIVIYNSPGLGCTNYTRTMVKENRATDLIDLIMYIKDETFPNTLKYITSEIGLSYYHDFEEDVPESFKFLNMLDDMNSGADTDKDIILRPIDEDILGYYNDYVNDLFEEDNIDYYTQKEFEIGFDMESSRFTIPIRSEIGDLVGVKGRYFYREVPENENKYIYLEPCSKSKILYGLYKTMSYIKSTGRVYVGESEKFVLQLWSYGFRNAVSTGGKTLSRYQIDMLVRLGVDVVLCFDKDVTKSELEDIATKFPEGMPLYYVYDEFDILEGHESPSDDPTKWSELVTNIYKLR